MLSVFFIEIDCPQLIKYLVYLTRLKNEKSQKSHSKNLIVSQRRLRKVSYPAHIPYAQLHELANKFPSNKKIMTCLFQEFSVIGHLWDAFKKQAYAETPCCIKKLAVTEVDPCGGVDNHPTGVWYEIDKYVLSMKRQCPCVVQFHSGHTGY